MSGSDSNLTDKARIRAREREERLARALKANIGRRKEQSRARTADETGAAGREDGEGKGLA